jgi:hypothetical protein
MTADAGEGDLRLRELAWTAGRCTSAARPPAPQPNRPAYSGRPDRLTAAIRTRHVPVSTCCMPVTR